MVYNQGAALAAAGKIDDAVTALQKSAVAREENVAAASLALLAQIAVGNAQKALAENPVETEPDKRKECLNLLESAEKYYSESFSLQKTKAVANALEQIRAWRSKITAEWDDADRQKKRQNEVMERIQGIAEEQKNVNQAVEPETQTPDSPRRFQICYEKTKEQRQIAEETERVKTTLDETEAPTENASPFSALPQIQQLMNEAADDLSKNRPADAFPKQQKALELLQEILKQQQEQNPEQQQNDKQEENSQKTQDENKPENSENKENKENQEQQEQNQNEQKQEPQKDEKQTANEKDGGSNNEENSKEQEREKAEQRLRQVRRRQQEADERRERVKTFLMQAEPVEKDW